MSQNHNPERIESAFGALAGNRFFELDSDRGTVIPYE